jgi:hypothetical protein
MLEPASGASFIALEIFQHPELFGWLVFCAIIEDRR